jgi:hypothetical protein
MKSVSQHFDTIQSIKIKKINHLSIQLHKCISLCFKKKSPKKPNQSSHITY